eukprot:TRINITY_DN14426_c0_g1_i1.p1 TRINITY_DN14426_c0_g1~~TRINITY_DN14426_c0_g1_i1.p1  ORF type:complete len:240 (-),score=54.61 TRINITY_DN14426_c0_g1_i1:105-824(-)
MMDPEGPSIYDFVKGKQGPDLFKELYRLLPLVYAEDYYKNGVWQNEQMLMDIQIVDAHRKEAGAPEPMTLDDVKIPNLPGPGMTQTSAMAGMMRALQPGSVNGITPAAVSSTAPAGTIPAVSLTMPDIALFISKWKLDAMRTKTMLEKLIAPQRKFVLQNFKYIPAIGTVSTDKLEEYITKCETEKLWPSAEATATTTTTPDASTNGTPDGTATGGVKRPLEDASENEPNKKPNTNGTA